MRCTATTHEGNWKNRGPEHRCERPIGHAGLHRYTIERPSSGTFVQEFSNLQSVYPQYHGDRTELSE